MSKIKFALTKEQEKVLETEGNLLIQGGPGSGKTTVAILKAANLAKNQSQEYKRILFLSFARATVSRVIESINEHSLIDKDLKKKIVVDTYHAFFWRIIKTHGYLIGLPRKLSILLPANEAIALSSIRRQLETATISTKEKRIEELEVLRKIAFQEGKVAFDLFAQFTFLLLNGSSKIRNLLSLTYPVIILDEFQDTNFKQWKVVKSIGENSSLIALADPQQRIFDFAGADPKRLDQFQKSFSPTLFDLKNVNHRSTGTGILDFGNHILDGKFQESYKGVNFILYDSYPNPNQPFSRLKSITLKVRRRLLKEKKRNWTIAILVPTKKLVHQVSDYFNKETDRFPAIHHHAIIDMHGAVLAAEIISFLLQPSIRRNDKKAFIELLCNFYNGKGGDSPSKTNINEALRIQKAFDTYIESTAQNKNLPKRSIIIPILETFNNCQNLNYVGDPYEDWLAVRNTLESSNCKRLQDVAIHAKNLRLLNRGTQLRESLSQDWRINGSYINALESVRHSFLIEHFATSQKPESGVVVMNMHKAKGKQFDEVIIFEGWPTKKRGLIVRNYGRIVPGNIRNENLTQAKFNFRVSVTRAKMCTTILTPKDDPCVLLL